MTTDAPRPFVVMVRKFSGRKIPFNRYADGGTAQLVASRLQAVGCGARVIDERSAKDPQHARKTKARGASSGR